MRSSFLRVTALLAALGAAHSVTFGQQRKVANKLAVGKPAQKAAKTPTKVPEDVLDVSRTEDTVCCLWAWPICRVAHSLAQSLLTRLNILSLSAFLPVQVHQLNRVHLDRHRCHSVLTDAPPATDPFALVAADLEPLGTVVRDELDAESLTLRDSAQHFFGKGRAREGKRVRPVLVLLVGATTALNSPKREAETELDDEARAAAAEDAFTKRKQLAAITEMIHTASLIHDDVLDAADTRRGDAAVHRLYSTKAAVLSGDFLLARASVMLARMGHAQVVREMSKSLEALVQGELMQLKSSAEERLSLE